jgi:hypothetical protein
VKILMALLTFMAVSPLVPTAQDYTVVFEGRPIRKVESSFAATASTNLNADDSFKLSVRIVERNGKYYWASRGMGELIRREAGAYITFIAIDGAGYVRVGVPFLLDLRDQLPDGQRSQEIGYVEHLLTQFASITYYGNRLGAR